MRTITVKGIGSVSARPDYIALTLTIEARSPTYDAAMERASERIGLLEDMAEDLGFEKEVLKTVSFRAEEDYEHTRDEQGRFQRRFVGYLCSYRLKLAFDFDSKRLAEVLSAIACSGADPELGISFTVKEPARISEDLLTSAAVNARGKAEVLCRASGVGLGQLLSIDYNWGELNLFSRTQCEVEDRLRPLMVSSGCCGPSIVPDDIEVSDTVTFVWEMKE